MAEPLCKLDRPACDHDEDGPCSHWTKLRDRARRYLTLHDLYKDYWQLRRKEPAADLSQTYDELLAVAVAVYSTIADYERRRSHHEGTQDDPSAFWMFAQPHEGIAREAGPGIIDVYIDIMTDDNFLHSPPVRI